MRKNLSPWCQMIVALSPCLVFYDRNRRGGKEGGEGLEEEDMTLEALASNEISNFLVYDTISATPTSHHLNPYYFPSGNNGSDGCFLDKYASTLVGTSGPAWHEQPPNTSSSSSGRKKRRRRPRSCKNKEEAECQRMTHIAVERNRRRQMNEHLAVLRSLMPESYVQRGDQASIVGGAIDFVKELEQLLQSLEAQKRTLQNQHSKIESKGEEDAQSSNPSATKAAVDAGQPPFAQFFSYPQYMWCHASKEYPPDNSSVSGAYADIEVTLIETHTSLRILSRKRPGQLLNLVAGLQAMELNILHINVVTLESMVLYSISAKVEDGCNLTTVDDIAAAVHHMISLIEAEASAIN